MSSAASGSGSGSSSSNATITASAVSGVTTELGTLRGDVAALGREIATVRRDEDQTRARIGVLERGYQEVLIEMVDFQQSMAQQDALMRGLIGGFLDAEGVGITPGSGSVGVDDATMQGILQGRLGE